MRTDWFSEARFGLFIHWGVFSGPGRGEWLMSEAEMSREAYRDLAANFEAQDFEPRVWARLAREAGCRYAVLTAKHHDGYCLFRTDTTDFSSVAGRPGRDLVQEYVEAFRAEGLRVGLYFSLLDWQHPDFPVEGDPFHPLRRAAEARAPEACDLPRYRRFLLQQIEELLTQYGKIDLIWYDFSYPGHGPDFWGAADILALTRRLQPDILVNSRLEASGSDFATALDAEPSPFAGDFINPEMILPPYALKRRDGRPVRWESCLTMDNHWGYCPTDREQKPTALLIRTLVEAVSKGGNLLLNVSPDARGRIPEWQAMRLREMGQWLECNGEAIYGAGAADLPKPDWGFWTAKGERLYGHVFLPPAGPLPLRALEGQVKRAYRLADGFELRLTRPWSTAAFEGYAFVNWSLPDYYHYEQTEPLGTVLVLEKV